MWHSRIWTSIPRWSVSLREGWRNRLKRPRRGCWVGLVIFWPSRRDRMNLIPFAQPEKRFPLSLPLSPRFSAISSPSDRTTVCSPGSSSKPRLSLGFLFVFTPANGRDRAAKTSLCLPFLGLRFSIYLFPVFLKKKNATKNDDACSRQLASKEKGQNNSVKNAHRYE